MIDIHSHILPDIDDGPDSLALSVKLAGKASSQGVTAMFATPHSMDGVYQCSPREILDKCALLEAELEKKNIPVKILPGSEIRLTHDTVSLYDQGLLMTLNNRATHILIELPPMYIIDGVIHIIRQLAERGVVTVIAHPERNRAIMKNLNIMSRLIYEGAMMQITATSLMGGFGKNVMKICHKMIEKDVVAFIGSDIHPGRKFMMLDAYQKIQRMAGEEMVTKIFRQTPGEIMQPVVKEMNYVT